MSTHSHTGPAFPRGALIGAGGMIGITLIAVFGVKLGVFPAPLTTQQERVIDHARVAATRDFIFTDRADGALVASDAKSGDVVLVEAPGSNSGFIRGVLRGLARERMLHGKGHEIPFTVTQWSDGALTLTDQATGRVIELGSFGHTNRGAFAKLLVGAPKVDARTVPA